MFLYNSQSISRMLLSLFFVDSIVILCALFCSGAARYKSKDQLQQTVFDSNLQRTVFRSVAYKCCRRVNRYATTFRCASL